MFVIKELEEDWGCPHASVLGWCRHGGGPLKCTGDLRKRPKTCPLIEVTQLCKGEWEEVE